MMSTQSETGGQIQHLMYYSVHLYKSGCEGTSVLNCDAKGCHINSSVMCTPMHKESAVLIYTDGQVT